MANSLKKLEKYGVTFYESHGGFSFWLKMPAYINTNKLYNLAAKHGAVFIPGSIFTISYGSSTNFIRLSFTQVNEHEIELGIAILEKCLSDTEKGLKKVKTYPLI
jgi:DNA-binding transcriptional MocR family regulator